MRSLLVFPIVIAALFLLHIQPTNAGCFPPVGNVINCTDGPPNPDLMGVQESANPNNLTVNVLENAQIDTQGQPGNLDAIRTGGGNEQINVTNASLRAESAGIESEAGDDVINVILSIINSIERAIESGNDNDTVNVNGSNILSTEEIAIQSGNDNDKVTVENSQVTSLVNDGIETANHDDMVTITNSIITAGPGFFAVDLGNGNDMLTLNNGANLQGGIDCRDDIDTLVFAMQVPTDQIAAITAQIESLDPQGDSIFINNLFYEWQDCEELVAQLEPGFVSTVPTLSQWGLIIAAALLGIVGFMVVRRRQIA